MLIRFLKLIFKKIIDKISLSKNKHIPPVIPNTSDKKVI